MRSLLQAEADRFLVSKRLRAALQPIEHGKNNERERRQKKTERCCRIKIRARYGIEDFKRKRIRLSRNIAADHHRDAYFARSPGNAEKEAGQDLPAHEGERHPPKNRNGIRAVDARGEFKAQPAPAAEEPAKAE